MRRKTMFMTGLVLVLTLVLGGCGRPMTAAEIVSHVRETAESTKDAHAMVRVVGSVQGIELSATAEVWEKWPDKVRAEVIESSKAELKGAILVVDGQQAWLYDPTENKVMTGKAGELELPLPQQVLASMQEVVQQVLDATDAQLAGEEEVAGQPAYKLTLTPKEGQEAMLPGGGTATLWVDQERWIVLKAAYEAGGLGEGTLEMQSYELNQGLADELFQFEVPEGAEVVNAEAQKPLSLTLDEARAQAGFALLVPEYVPAGATLIEVFKQGEAIILRYDHSPTASFTVVQGTTVPELELLGQGQGMTVRGQSATGLSDAVSGSSLLYWVENGVTVSVAGRISLDEAVKVAESMK